MVNRKTGGTLKGFLRLLWRKQERGGVRRVRELWNRARSVQAVGKEKGRKK